MILKLLEQKLTNVVVSNDVVAALYNLRLRIYNLLCGLSWDRTLAIELFLNQLILSPTHATISISKKKTFGTSRSIRYIAIFMCSSC